MANETTLVVYRIGEGYPQTAEGKPLYSWPYTVLYAPDHPDGRVFYLGSGDARNGNGTFLSPAQVLEPQWRRDLKIAGVEWLLPLVERMAQGEPVESGEVLAAYERLHGEAPRREEWPLP